MKRILLTAVMLVLLPLTLDARRNGEGFFIGLGSGATYFDDGGLISDLNNNGGNFDMSNISGAYKLYFGYKFNHEATLESSFTGYGTYNIKNDGNTTEQLRPKSGVVSLNYGQDFLHNQLRPFVILGAGLLWLDPQKSTIYDNEIFFCLHYGLGLLYTPRTFGGLGFRAAYEADWSRFDTKPEWDGGAGYNTMIGTLYLGVEYKF